MNKEKSNATNASKNAEEKTCFIVTPIGSDADPIRRHIDGIIDAVIRPELRDKGYKVIVPHRVPNPGTITKQIVQDIYNSDLVIVNLTGNNPNVMYELALRHCFNKPLILIAERGTKLPFDIVVERTIYYINDAQGVLELREQLSEALSAVEKGAYESPIYTILNTYRLEETLKAERDDSKNGKEWKQAFSLILYRLDQIEARQPEHSSGQFQSEKMYNRLLRIFPEDSSNEEIANMEADIEMALIPTLITKTDVSFDWHLDSNGVAVFRYKVRTKEAFYTFLNVVRDFCDRYSYRFEPFNPKLK